MLVLPIKKKWFDMIRSGEKKEEYREIKPYYKTRFYNAIKEELDKETREMLMNKAKLTPRLFRTELGKLRHKYIIINDNGYYMPANIEEYEEFIEKQNERYYEIRKTIDLAYKEMKGLNE